MRKLLISIFLAGAAASPALAEPQDQDSGRWHREQKQNDRAQAHEERQQQREERQQQRDEVRAERFNGGGFDRAQQVRPDRPAPPQFEMRQQVQDDPRGGFDLQRFDRGDRAPQQADAPPQEYRRAYRGGFDGAQAEQRGEDNRWSRDGNRWNRDAGDLRQSERPLPNVMRSPNPLIVSRTPREGTQPPPREELRRRSEVQWSTNWRHDGRYDWRNWRDRHRSTFHVGIYYDPFGWGYRPYQIGWRLWPSYYSRQYWIDDPWEYRLPYAPPGTVWVRYWDDALLVDTWTGEVIDVIHGFFW